MRKAKGSYRSYSFLVKLQPWVLSFKVKHLPSAELQPCACRRTCPWAELSDDDDDDDEAFTENIPGEPSRAGLLTTLTVADSYVTTHVTTCGGFIHVTNSQFMFENDVHTCAIWQTTLPLKPGPATRSSSFSEMAPIPSGYFV